MARVNHIRNGAMLQYSSKEAVYKALFKEDEATNRRNTRFELFRHEIAKNADVRELNLSLEGLAPLFYLTEQLKGALGQPGMNFKKTAMISTSPGNYETVFVLPGRDKATRNPFLIQCIGVKETSRSRQLETVVLNLMNNKLSMNRTLNVQLDRDLSAHMLNDPLFKKGIVNLVL